MQTITLNLKPAISLTHEQFEQIAIANHDLCLELTAKGELVIMPPTGGITGNRNIDIAFQLQAWNRQYQLGVAFDSSTLFRLPNGAQRSPDAAWVAQARWDSLTHEDKESFPPLCPDFAIELRSKSDSLKTLQAKMQEYIDNGLRLGWLINPQNQQVEIYRIGQPVEVLNSPQTLSGENVLPEFVLDLSQILQ